MPATPLFRKHVLSVVSLRSQKQVGRIHAGLVIAAVEYAQPAQNWAIDELPAYAMGGDGRAVPSARAHHAVAVAAERSKPRPAVVGAAAINLGPKPHRQRLALVGAARSTRASEVRVHPSNGSTLPCPRRAA